MTKLRLRDHAEISGCERNKILGLIGRSYEYLDAVSLKSLYTNLVKPHLEYGHTVWPQNYKTDLTLQRERAASSNKVGSCTKRSLEYTDRLKTTQSTINAYRR